MAGTRIVPTVEVTDGDQGRKVAKVAIGEVTITVYESLFASGRVVIDIDTETERLLNEPEFLAVTINDHYVHGGPVRATETKEN